MSFRLPPEWDPHDGVWIGFPSDPGLWLDDLAGAQAEVAAFALAVHAEGAGEKVTLVCANDTAADAALTLTGNLVAIEIAPFFDIWLRDTGPIMVRNGDGLSGLDYRGNGWGGKYPSPLDDALAALLLAKAGLARDPRDWVLEGGAIDVDGTGWLVTTTQCLLNPNRNPGLTSDQIEARLSADLGITKFLWLGDGLANDHTDGHVDNIARFVAPGVLALPVASGNDDPNRAAFIAARQRASQSGLRIVDIPSVGRLEDEEGTPIPASHMNFYIGNATVVVPTYGSPSDVPAVEAISALFPGRRTVGLPASHLLTGGGSFHCISQQIPAR